MPASRYLEAFDQGAYGTGPFVYLDPSRRNMLTVNQSGATSETNDASNFTALATGGSLASELTTVKRGPRSLKWVTGAAASPVLSLDSHRRLPRDPGRHPRVQLRCAGARDRRERHAGRAPDVARQSRRHAVHGGRQRTAVTSGAWTAVKVANAVAPAGSAFVQLHVGGHRLRWHISR
jgi:hypothetical protein